MTNNHYSTKQVIVMRTDLNMRKGKMIAQGAHASMAFMTRRLQRAELASNPDWLQLSEVERQWLDNSFAKICLGVGSEAALRLVCGSARIEGLIVHEIVDNGTTEFGGVPTLTCAAIGPDYSELIDRVTGGLKLL